MCLASVKMVPALALTPAFLESSPFCTLVGCSGSLADHIPKQQGQAHGAEEQSVFISPWDSCIWKQEGSSSRCLESLEVDIKARVH